MAMVMVMMIIIITIMISGIHGGNMTGGAREFEAMPTPVHTPPYVILF